MFYSIPILSLGINFTYWHLCCQKYSKAQTKMQLKRLMSRILVVLVAQNGWNLHLKQLSLQDSVVTWVFSPTIVSPQRVLLILLWSTGHRSSRSRCRRRYQNFCHVVSRSKTSWLSKTTHTWELNKTVAIKSVLNNHELINDSNSVRRPKFLNISDTPYG